MGCLWNSLGTCNFRNNFKNFRRRVGHKILVDKPVPGDGMANNFCFRKTIFGSPHIRNSLSYFGRIILYGRSSFLYEKAMEVFPCGMAYFRPSWNGNALFRSAFFMRCLNI